MNKIDNKYFTPSLEDIRVGYEAEVSWEYYRNPDGTKSSNPDGWKPVVFKGVDEAVRKYHSLGMYRVPYLTKEQIEAEGWKDLHNVSNKDLWAFEKGNRFISLKKGILQVIVRDPSREEEVFGVAPEHFRFICPCKDINTFRYICKLLKIA